MSWSRLVAMPLLLAATQEPPAYRVNVEAVHVDVFASDEHGAPLFGLGPDDFALFDDGVPQTIDLVDLNLEREPMTVALVLDASDSVAGSTLTRLKSAAHTFLRGLGAADRVTVITFSHSVHLLSPMTSDFGALRDGIDRIQAGGATAWHDALFAGLELLEGSSRRPLLLLFTDGEDTYSWLDGGELLPLVTQSSAVVYAVSKAARSNGKPKRTVRVELLDDVTRAGGGRLIEAASTAELEVAFARVVREMRHRYFLSYQPRGVPREGWHTIEVELRGRTGEVRARRGYFYRSSPRD